MRNYSIVIPELLHQQLYNYLVRMDQQEDLCFATYVPSTGSVRTTAILSSIVWPEPGDRDVHGNVGFMPQYLQRALQVAGARKEGLVLLHSHPTDGWQDMSRDDKVAESRTSPAVYGITGLPFVGLTIGTDGAWSGRFWLKDRVKKREYHLQWCESVRVIGQKLTITFNDRLLTPTFDLGKQLRTISAWGNATQEDLSRLKVGIVGLGSVGSIVAEILARTGIAHFTLIDFDSVEEKNLDRLTNIFKNDIGEAKVKAIADAISRSATAPGLTIEACEYSVCEKEGYEAALDCDVLFSCVDRPWPRQVLNFIAYAHFIPVIDGGILVRTNKRNTCIIGADWKAHTVGYGRPCMECLGQYKTENAVLEMDGKLDDPEYIKGLDPSVYQDAHENVFPFSSHLASMEVLQLLSLFIAPSGISNVGQQMYHFVVGAMESSHKQQCEENCFFLFNSGKGDFTGITPWGHHEVAVQARAARIKKNLDNFHRAGAKRRFRSAVSMFKKWVRRILV